MRRALGILVFCSVPWLASCGSGPTAPSDTPVAPSISEPHAVNVASIAVTPPNAVLALGATQTMTATATMSDQSTRALTHGGWRSEDPSIAIVKPGGEVTAVGTGVTSIIVELDGVQSAAIVSVHADYQGLFAGSYLVTDCRDTEEFSTYHVCASMFPPNSGVPYNLAFDLTQMDHALSGTAFFDTLDQALAPTTIARDGSAKTTSHLQYLTSPIDVTWNLQQSVPGQIDGTFVMRWTNSVHTGSMTVTAVLQNVVRTTSTAGVRPTTRGGWRGGPFFGR